ncbi:hypothetical protein BDB00DRAFT_871013 [Zychaea mexicana]|uniref:uncharacterized protein n=1 Tax=Zychaea mexicana TaxID=64656 RepID=UPI0022FDC08A|nr:uncharacterized protein BDB00DRAFT_871013 [Zychaea mexicana]KAI9494726.1 hypothetical protein BDB00DRAFT_871013 [Zychaea mexicana]
MRPPHPPPFADADSGPWHDLMMPDDEVWGNAMEEPPHGWERIEDDPFVDRMDQIGPGSGGPPSKHQHPPSRDRDPSGPPPDGHLEAAKHDKHHHHHTTTRKETHHHHHHTTTSEHKESTSSSHHTTSSTTSSSVATTHTPTDGAPPSPPPSSPPLPSTAQQHNAVPSPDPAITPSSLFESPVLVSSSPTPPSSPLPPSAHDDDDEQQEKAIQDIDRNNQAQQQTSYVVSTVYAVNTIMPGSYPRIDYNEIDYGQLGQIGVFTDGAPSSHELHAMPFYMSFAVALTLLFMLRNI